MLFFKSVLVLLLNFLIRSVKSEETVNVTTTEQISVAVTEKTTENFLNFLNLEDVSTMEYKIAPEVSLNDLNVSTSLPELNVLKDMDSTPSWELIYPDQNTTTSEKSLSSTPASLELSSTTATSTTTTTTIATAKLVAKLPKYFKGI